MKIIGSPKKVVLKIENESLLGLDYINYTNILTEYYNISDPAPNIMRDSNVSSVFLLFVTTSTEVYESAASLHFSLGFSPGSQICHR